MFGVFRLMGRDYEAAVMSSGFVGFMLGTTANAMANMEAMVQRFSRRRSAFLVVPMVGAFFIDFTNALIITVFLNFYRDSAKMTTSTTPLTRERAWALLTEYTKGESLLKHALAVEAAVRGYARRFGEDEEFWGITALLHDFDYERCRPREHPFRGDRRSCARRAIPRR